ncbi:hypothetical protein CROQUDRAFT_96646 [Cronartium quercuum f. sp. fusiforme G11]|uniref:Uncharacterized protein n=1 Tax=Cronartium quercuum f. sp. fusiforme G11 TaxID=708437 RepID=A0A9P6T918_9BASI|nr:hypothetical protein CROQUDRAFT_96646 [Cronartium quercuum f. sp. fusiforme G11]
MGAVLKSHNSYVDVISSQLCHRVFRAWQQDVSSKPLRRDGAKLFHCLRPKAEPPAKARCQIDNEVVNFAGETRRQIALGLRDGVVCLYSMLSSNANLPSLISGLEMLVLSQVLNVTTSNIFKGPISAEWGRTQTEDVVNCLGDETEENAEKDVER